MTKEIAMKWVEALRSGKYEQGKSYLRFDDYHSVKYCCLGVLGAISGMSEEDLDDADNLEGFEIKCGIATAYGHLSDSRTYFNHEEYSSLSGANDSGVSFAIIADWIEKTYEGL